MIGGAGWRGHLVLRTLPCLQPRDQETAATLSTISSVSHEGLSARYGVWPLKLSLCTDVAMILLAIRMNA